MFTQCPECGTVFRVTATVLRAAQGQVRCGVCDANFDALRFLTDAVDSEPPASTSPDPRAAPPAPAPPPSALPPSAPPPSAPPPSAPPPSAPAPAAPATTAPATRPAAPATTAPATRLAAPPATPAAAAPATRPVPPPAAPAAAAPATRAATPAATPRAAPPASPPVARVPPAPAAAPPAPPARTAPPPAAAPRAATPRADAPPTGAPRERGAATRSTPSVDEDRELAEIAAALARDARASELRAQRFAATAVIEARSPRTAEPPEDVNVLEPADVEHIVLGGEETGEDEIPDAALEFDAPPGEWDRVFVPDRASRAITPLDINFEALEDSLKGAAPSDDDEIRFDDEAERRGPAAAARTELALADEEALSRTDEYAMLELSLASESAGAAAHAGDPATAAEAGGVEEAWFDPALPSIPAPRVVARREPVATPLPAPDAPLDEEPLSIEPARALPERPALRWPLVAGSAVLGVALVVQLIHSNHDSLADTGFAGRPIAALYARLGHPVEPHWDLGAYDVKQWGAASDNAPGALRLRASVLNRAPRAQPYPLLRVTLEDRFGAKVARREFTPAEYLPGRAAPTQLLAPGARADADLSLADPGSQAVGFELDVCLLRGGVLSCGTELKNPGSG